MSYAPYAYARPFTVAISCRASIAFPFTLKNLVTPRQRNLFYSPYYCPRLYSTSSKGVPHSRYTTVFLTCTVGLVVASGIYGARQCWKPSRVEPASLTSGSALKPNYASPKELQLAIQELQDGFLGKTTIQTDSETLRLYGSSENSYHPASPHSVVVHVRSTDDVVKVVNISRKYRVPLTAYSGATSLEGHFSGVCMLLSLCHRLLMVFN
jgi:hypothetical protein